MPVREFFSLKQNEFSEMLGIKRQNYLSRYENGEHEFTDDLKLKLVDVLIQKYKKRINLDWFMSGNGEMFMSEPERKPLKVSFVAELEAIIDQRLENIEEQIVEIRNHIKKAGTPPSESPDSSLYVLEPEPEYGEVEEDITLVEGVAAGKPIYQSDVQSTIRVPKQYIKTKSEDYYVWRIKGTSMTAAGILDGCLALFRISDVPRDGAIQIVEWQGEATLKQIREVPGKGWKICFEDGSEKDIEIGPGDEFQIQGDFITISPLRDMRPQEKPRCILPIPGKNITRNDAHPSANRK